MLAVALGNDPLHPGIEADDVARDVAQFIVGERLVGIDALAALRLAGKTAQAGDVVAQTTCGEVGEHAEQQGDAQHEADEGAVHGKQVGKPDRAVRHRRTHDNRAVEHGGVEVALAVQLRMAADGVARAPHKGGGYLGTAAVVGGRQGVQRVVEQHRPRAVDDGDAQVVERQPVPRHKGIRRSAFGKGVQQFQVEELQARVQLLHLEAHLAFVLEKEEAARQRPRAEKQQQEQLVPVGEAPMPENRSHSRCA